MGQMLAVPVPEVGQRYAVLVCTSHNPDSTDTCFIQYRLKFKTFSELPIQNSLNHPYP